MAITIVATAGAADANSFVTLAEANTQIEGRLNASTWETDATDDQKNRALAEATRYLSAFAHWIGKRADDTQALAWPRQLATNPDSPSFVYFGTDEVPDRVKRGTIELAFQFIKSGTSDVAALPSTSEVKRKKVDVLETEYFDRSARPQGLALYPSVLREIGPLLEQVGAFGTVTRG